MFTLFILIAIKENKMESLKSVNILQEAY